jgi:hypothetical protein
MQCSGADRLEPELKNVVMEASRALARLDADRLEEMALSCQALNRDLKSLTGANSAEIVRQAIGAEGEMATFARVLDATRANFEVLQRVLDLHEGTMDYGRARSRTLRSRDWDLRRWARAETQHGNH